LPLTHEDVRKVALLSRLELTDAEIDAQTKPLNDLMQQFEVLKELDVTGIEPTSHSIPVVNVFREDVEAPSLPRDLLLSNAPEARDGCFVVPRIVAD
jgi:aspartyl-tRNA(Asn)/glutamyl-tRNA(Gln) amidotransferase subunit C